MIIPRAGWNRSKPKEAGIFTSGSVLRRRKIPFTRFLSNCRFCSESYSEDRSRDSAFFVKTLNLQAFYDKVCINSV